MILSLIVLVPLLIASLFAFFKLSPKDSDLKKIRMYNFSTIVAAILLSVVFSLKVRASMIGGSDAAWWPYIAFTFSPLVLAATVLASGILRNLIFFRKK